jgi:H+/Cl- antiporter ClcA
MPFPAFQAAVSALKVHSLRWRRRLTFVGGGLIVGILAVGLAEASDYVQSLFQAAVSHWPYLPLLLTPIGFALTVLLVQRVFPNTHGSGIPQAIAARTLQDHGARGALVGLRVAIGKILLTLLGLLVGASTGREGPTVQVGASVMFEIGRITPRRQPGLILAGAAAGVAGAFNAPLAGIVFAIEEMSKSFEARASGLIVAAVILAGLVAEALVGNYTYFGFTTAALPLGTAWMAVPICGVLGGFSGAGFARILVAAPDALPGGARFRKHPIIFAGLCGLGVALCGLLSGGQVFGTGYQQAHAVLHHTGTVSLDYAPLKFLATALSSIAGVPGGIFSPSLSVGAGLGADVARFFHHVDPGPIVLLGMVAYFTGVVRAPITAFVIVSEMTGDHGILVALMATALIADFCARAINREGVYHLLSKRFLANSMQTDKSTPG